VSNNAVTVTSSQTSPLWTWRHYIATMVPDWGERIKIPFYSRL